MSCPPQPNHPLALVVDDNATFRMLSRMSLEQVDLRVEEASSGQAAMDFTASTRPDIIVLDLQMSGMDGFTVCQQIRKLPGGEFIPILIMTGLDDVDSIAKAYEMGAIDFIVKPCHGHHSECPRSVYCCGGSRDERSAAFLRMQGCEAYQGYLFSKPVPADQLEHLLRYWLSDDAT